jgi:tungstate transport system substrate-binding protein
MQSVIIPGFEAAYQQEHGSPITMSYIHTGTGQAIAQAEAGTASGLVVHAASLENSFVSQGYSLEKYGRAIFWGDYVLLGPASDPAGVKTGDSKEDIVQAYQKIATEGAAGDAEFVSRGGNPGTTIAEHAIWALTTGIPTCTVPDVDGGGASPSTTPGTCPTIASGTPINYPSWYHATGAAQGANIQAADSCNFGAASNDCYVFTDRGTYDFLKSSLVNMQLTVNDNDLAPAAQANLLVNSFHMYAVNPAKFSGSTAAGINTSAMTDLLNWITSPAGQSAVEGYLQANGDEPFRPSAAPALTAGPLPSKVVATKPATIVGSLKNVVPGTPALNGVKISVTATDHGKTTTVTSGTTDKKGNFFIPFVPTSNTASYSISSPKNLQKIEIGKPTLDPVFGDILQQSTLALGDTSVKGAVSVSKVTASGKSKVAVKGKVLPGVTRKAGQLQLWAGHPGGKLKQKGQKKLAVGTASFNDTFKLGKGTWVFQLKYVNNTVVQTGTSPRERIKLG